jgi:methionyl-tRNA synthetase
MQTEVFMYAKPFRCTIKTGAFTKYIAWCDTCKSVVEPTRIERSKTGAHGTDYWVHPHPLAFIAITQSNRGARTVHAEPDFPETLKQLIERLWLYEGLDPNELINELMFYLSGVF